MINWETLRTDDLTVGEDNVDMGVIVIPIGISSGIDEVMPNIKGDTVIFNLLGQPMSGDLITLPHGIYIVGGKKVAK